MAIHIDVVADLNRRHIRDSARDMQRDIQKAGMEAGRSFGDQFGAGVQKASPKIEKGLNKVADATGKVRVEQERLNNMQKQGVQSSDKLVAQHERLAKARRDESSATRALAQEMQSLATTNVSTGSSLRSVGSAMSLIGGAARSPAALAGLVPVLASLGNVAVTASGSLLMLPGALGAAAGAFGTLKIATSGFSDALESISDPEKFAESLKKLSPAAQQAALSIQALMPVLTQFKDATQDALFAGVGTQLNSMAASLLPQIQQMTTSVATSFNQMFMGATNTLMANPALVSGITQNISAAFQNIAPAASSMTKAIAELTATGSDFLPQLAQGAANAAQSFSNFMTEASQSGQLRQWIQDGIDVMRMLGDTVVAAGQMFMALGADGTSTMASIKMGVENVSTAVRIVTGDLAAWNDVFPSIGEIARKTFEDIAETIDSMLLDPMREVIKIANMIPGMPKIPNIPEIARSGGLQGGGGSFGTPGMPGVPGVPAGGYQVPTPGSWFPGIGTNGQRGGGFYTQGQPGYAAGTAPEWAQGGRSGGAGGGSASGPVAPYTGDPMSMLQGMPVNAQLYGAAGAVLDSQHRLAQSEAELNALLESNDATAEQIQDKRNDIAKAEREQHEAELRLIEAKQSATESFTNTMSGAASSLGDIGAALDADLGISKGLPGLADNLVRFLGSLAMAPIAGALSGVQQGLGYQPGSAGKGIFGMLAGSGALGSQYVMTPGMNNQQAGGYPGGYPGDAALLANVPAGRYTQEQRGDLTQGLADCSSAVEDLVNLMDGKSTAGASMYTGNAAQWLQSRGFMPGSMPGAFNVGFNQQHMQATLPGGTNFNWGSNASAARGGVGGNTGAYDPAFTDHYYRPVGATGAQGGPSWQGPGIPSGLSGGVGQSPVLGAQNGLPIGTGAGRGGPQTGIGSQSYNNPVGGEGFAGVGGLPMALAQGAISAGGGAASMFGGQAASAAAQMLMELGNRAVAFGGQAASIGVSALGETLLPSGDSPDASIGNSWFGRIAGGLAGARPATPNVAGQAPTAEQKAQGQQTGQPQAEQGGGDQSKQVGVNIENYNVTKGEDRAGQDLARHQTAGLQAQQGIR